MVKIRYSKIKQSKAKICIANQLLQKHPICFSMSPFFVNKTFGNRFSCLFQQILISNWTVNLWTLFRFVALIFLNAFTKSATLCCCIVKTICRAHIPLAMLKQETSSCDPCSWNSKCIKNYSLRRTSSISKSSFRPQNHGW